MLKFIKETELKIRRFENILNAISDKDNAIIDEVEEMAISEIKSYLYSKYDIDTIFSQVDNKRNPTIKRIVLDFMYCFLFERVASNEIPDSVVDRCEKNEALLMKFSKGELNPNLPLLDPELEASSMMRMGSETKFIDE